MGKIEQDKDYPYIILNIIPGVYSRCKVNPREGKNPTYYINKAKELACKLRIITCLAWDENNFYYIKGEKVIHKNTLTDDIDS